MRQLSSILLFFLMTNSYGQEIELKGRYGAFFIGGETIEFVGKDSFYFNGFYCTNGVHGKGRCEIKNGSLYLYFEKNKSKTKKVPLKPAIITSTESVNGIFLIQITLLDNSDIPIPYASVEIERRNSTNLGTMTDSLGQVSVTIENTAFPIVIKSSTMGIQPGKLKLDSAANYTIQLFHLQDNLFNKELNKGEIYVYEIDELSEDHILMRPQKSSERFRIYEKKKD